MIKVTFHTNCFPEWRGHLRELYRRKNIKANIHINTESTDGVMGELQLTFEEDKHFTHFCLQIPTWDQTNCRITVETL